MSMFNFLGGMFFGILLTSIFVAFYQATAPLPVCPDCRADLHRTYDGGWYCWHCHFENKAKA